MINANGALTLDQKPETIPDIFEFLTNATRGKTVLNVGVAGGVEGYLPQNRDIWLHHRLGLVAKELVGIDIDTRAIEHAARHGVRIDNANCETMDLGRKFDVIVMSDVIEHLNGPGLAVSNLAKHLSPGGQILITTPNPTAFGSLVRTALGKSVTIFHDHVSSFLPENIEALCVRFGLKLHKVYFFSHMDNRKLAYAVKSRINRLVATGLTRLHGSYLAVVEART